MSSSVLFLLQKLRKIALNYIAKTWDSKSMVCLPRARKGCWCAMYLFSIVEQWDCTSEQQNCCSGIEVKF